MFGSGTDLDAACHRFGPRELLADALAVVSCPGISCVMTWSCTSTRGEAYGRSPRKLTPDSTKGPHLC